MIKVDVNPEETIGKSPSETLASLPGERIPVSERVIDTARKEHSGFSFAIDKTSEGHHPKHSLAKDMAHRHEVLRAEGREGPLGGAYQNVSPTIRSSSAPSTLSRAEQAGSIFSLTAKKGRGVGELDDAELEELIQRHPELAQHIQELKQQRDELVAGASSTKQNALQSKGNLEAKTDIIATYLEGAPLPAELHAALLVTAHLQDTSR